MHRGAANSHFGSQGGLGKHLRGLEGAVNDLLFDEVIGALRGRLHSFIGHASILHASLHASKRVVALCGERI